MGVPAERSEAGAKRRPQVPAGSTAGGDGPPPHTGAARESLRGGVWCAVGHGSSEGRPYLSPVPHTGTEDARRGDGGLVQRVPKRLPVPPVYREVLHVERLLRGDRLHRHETGGRGSAQRGGPAFWGRGEPAAPTGVSTRGEGAGAERFFYLTSITLSSSTILILVSRQSLQGSRGQGRRACGKDRRQAMHGGLGAL